MPAVVGVGATAFSKLTTTLDEAVKRDSTLVRTHGEVVIQSSGGAQAFGAYGIYVASENVDLSSQVPDPELDDADWLLHRLWYLVSDISAVGAEDVFQSRYMIEDSRGKRKLNENERDLLMVFKNSGSSAAGVTVGWAYRMLFMRA